MKVLKKIGNACLVQFDCHLRPFRLQIDLDDQTQPHIVSLLFEEANDAGRVLMDPIRVDVKLKAKDFQEIKPETARHNQQRTLVSELFRDISRTLMRIILDQIKATEFDEDTCFSAFKMSRQEIREGILVSYTEVMTYGEDDSGSPLPWFGYELTHGTQQYLINDLYCPNPNCDCRAVHLEFSEVLSRTTKRVFVLRVGFDAKIMEIEDRKSYSKLQTKALYKQLLAENPELPIECERRYKKIRQTTQQVLGTLPLIPKSDFPSRPTTQRKIISLPPQKPSTKIGRNSPCPCGSGNKYKQCCGQQVAY